MNQSNQKKFLILMIVGFTLVLTLGSSYALLRNSQIGNNSYTMNVGNLEVTFQDERTNALTITNMYPMTDEEGLSQEDELTFVVKNTGNLPATYNVYIEETSTSPAFKTVIRYVDKKGTNAYSDVKVLNDNKYIDERARLSVNEEATYKVKLWLSEEADTTYMNKTFRAKIVVDALQDMGSTLLNDIYHPKNASCKTYVEEDGIIYISGSKDCIDFNYVWYSGKLWRITAIYPDGSMKMITEDLITAIYWGSNIEYDGSYIYQWLNEDFKDTLINPNSILKEDAIWNYSTDGNSTPVKPETIETQKTKIAPIGLLNAYEYYKSYQNTIDDYGYLNIGYFWWLITPYSVSSVRYVGDIGYLNYISPSSSMIGSRPTVILQSDILLTGSGTKNDPYKISGNAYNAANDGDLLNTRFSGEYVKFDGDLYRIVSTENSITKLTKIDYIRDGSNNVVNKNFASTLYFGKSTNSQTETYWDYYLNNTWYNSISPIYKSMIIDGTFYLGLYIYNGNYKQTICKDTVSELDSKVTKIGEVNSCTRYTSSDTDKTYVGKVGLQRVGEMFSSQLGSGSSSSSDIWLITPSDASYVYNVGFNGGVLYYSPSSNAFGSRPSINLKSTIIIAGGTGLEEDPYTIEDSDNT